METDAVMSLWTVFLMACNLSSCTGILVTNKQFVGCLSIEFSFLKTSVASFK